MSIFGKAWRAVRALLPLLFLAAAGCHHRFPLPYTSEQLVKDSKNWPGEALVHYLTQQNADLAVCTLAAPNTLRRTDEELVEPFVASLADIGRPVDMVDIFRNSTHIMPVVEEALRLDPLPKVIWMQLGARDDAAAARAEAAGIKVVMNRCPKIEYGRLSSEISWMGVNSRTLSSKRAPMPTQGMRLSLNRTSVGGGETAASDRAAKNRTDVT